MPPPTKEEIARRLGFVGPDATAALPEFTVGGERLQEVARQLSGQQTLLRAEGTDRVVGAGELAFGAPEVGPVQEPTLRSFTDLLLSSEQQGTLDRLRRTAAARGLRGGAIESQLQRATENLLATNRASGFAGVSGAAERVFGRFQQQTGAFLSQVGELQSALDINDPRSATAIVQQGSANLKEFAGPLVQALVGIGQQRAVTAGLLLGQNVDLAQFGLTKQERQVASAVNQFLNPRLTQEQQGQVQERQRGISNQFSRQNVGVAAVASARVSAGEFLSNIVQAPVRQFSSALSQIRGAAPTISAFIANRAAGGTQELLDPRTASAFSSVFNTLRGNFAQPAVSPTTNLQGPLFGA